MTMGRTKHRKPVVPLKSKLKKDPGIPRLPDLKVKNAAKQRAHVPSVGGSHSTDPDAMMASEPTLSSLAFMAESESSAFQDPSSSTSGQGKTKEQIRKHYVRTLHKVIDESDIVILVLDARDPEGCRSRLVEEEVRRREAEGKKLVFVLNKIDLIPKYNAQAWLKYLRHSTPTLPFLSPSSAQHQRTNISSSTAPALLKLLKAYKPKATSIAIGVVGYPNVGKSSLINSLKRSKVCAVAAQPGHTKDLQSVQLERGMRIIDSPGVVFDDDTDAEQKQGSILLRNVVKVEDVEDPIAVVEEILLRTPPETVQKLYSLPTFSNTLEFLTMLALTSGRLLKGGTPDILSAARHVLMDWNHQKIPYFSEPPSIHPSMAPSSTAGAENVGQAQILTELSQPFQLDGLFSAADVGAFGAGNPNSADVEMDADGDMFWDASEGLAGEEADAVMDEPPPESRRTSMKRARSPSPGPAAMTDDSISSRNLRQPKRLRKNKMENDLGTQHAQMAKSNPLNRKVLKKERKKARRALKLESSGNGGMDIDDSGGGLEFTFMASVP